MLIGDIDTQCLYHLCTMIEIMAISNRVSS